MKFPHLLGWDIYLERGLLDETILGESINSNTDKLLSPQTFTSLQQDKIKSENKSRWANS